MEIQERNEPMKNKRKHKRSANQQFLKSIRNRKSYAKGTIVESDDYEYFSRVFTLSRTFEGTEEEKVVFANNSLAQTENKEVEYSSNQLISRVIEILLPIASTEVLARFFNAFSKNLRPICNQAFASHVLQTLMISAAKRIQDDHNKEENEEYKIVCKKWLLEVCKFLLNNMEEYISETYANPVLRTAMYCLAGAPHLDKASTHLQNTFNKNNTVTETTSKPSLEFVRLLEEFFTRVSKWPQFKEFVDSPLQSGFLQHLLITFHLVNIKAYKTLKKKILTDCFPSGENNNNTSLSSPTALPVLEVIIHNSTQKELKKIYSTLVAGKVADMLPVRTANFTLTKLLDKSEDPELVADIVSEFLPHFKSILSNNQPALLASLCAACVRSKSAQSHFFQGIGEVFNCKDNVDLLVPAVLALTPLPLPTPTPTANKFGSMIVQSLLNFQKPIKAVTSLLSYNSEDLASLLASNYGSFITSAFCKSDFVGEKNRQKFIHHLMGHFTHLVTSKSGSRSFDDIWDIADDKNRERIVRELSSATAKVMSSNFGKFVAAKVQLQDFCVLGPDKWRDKIKSIETKKKLFAPLIGEKRKIKTENCGKDFNNKIGDSESQNTDKNYSNELSIQIKRKKRSKHFDEGIFKECSESENLTTEQKFDVCEISVKEKKKKKNKHFIGNCVTVSSKMDHKGKWKKNDNQSIDAKTEISGYKILNTKTFVPMDDLNTKPYRKSFKPIVNEEKKTQINNISEITQDIVFLNKKYPKTQSVSSNIDTKTSLGTEDVESSYLHSKPKKRKKFNSQK